MGIAELVITETHQNDQSISRSVGCREGRGRLYIRPQAAKASNVTYIIVQFIKLFTVPPFLS